MKRLVVALPLLLSLAAAAGAAPNVANVTQKGSLLLFPLIFGFNDSNSTIVRIQNDGAGDIDVKCYWMDWNKHRVDFVLTLTRNQAAWFDAFSGRGSSQVNAFPHTPSNGFTAGSRHPFSAGDGFSPTGWGMLACWAVAEGGESQVKWNHLSGTATIYQNVGQPNQGLGRAAEYNAYAFAVPTGVDLAPVGTPGTMRLDGLSYDACPLYQIGQFSAPLAPVAPVTRSQTTYLLSCSLDLKQDWAPAWTKWQFDVWNEDEVKFTGAYECADSWHPVDFFEGTLQRTDTGEANPGDVAYAYTNGLDAAAQNFALATLGTGAARYRVQGVQSSQCDRAKPSSGRGSSIAAVTTQAVGVLGVQLTLVNPIKYSGSTMAGAGKFNGAIQWDPAGAVPESGGR